MQSLAPGARVSLLAPSSNQPQPATILSSGGGEGGLVVVTDAGAQQWRSPTKATADRLVIRQQVGVEAREGTREDGIGGEGSEGERSGGKAGCREEGKGGEEGFRRARGAG